MTSSTPAYGVLRPITETASVLLCENPGTMTLEGTNTWVLRAPGSDEMVVVDPGPDDAGHIGRLAALGPIPLVLISHRHSDHTDGIDGLVFQCPGKAPGLPAAGVVQRNVQLALDAGVHVPGGFAVAQGDNAGSVHSGHILLEMRKSLPS